MARVAAALSLAGRRCGTGALVEAIVEGAEPHTVLGVDRSNGFVAHARGNVSGAETVFGQGPAPAYAMSLPDERRVALREAIRRNLPIAPDGSIPLVARAWAARGRKRP